MSDPQPRIVITAGGTGGHIFPALAVAKYLMAKGVSVSWIGTANGMEARVVPEHGIEMDFIEVSGLRGNGLKGWLMAPFTLTKASFQALKILQKRQPAAVLGLGGFVTGPVGFCAWINKIPLLIHEQNAVAGMTNKLLSRFATTILEAFPGALPSSSKTELTGNPVRQEILDLSNPIARLGERSGRARLLVVGGSLGAKVLNEVVPVAVSRLAEGLRPLVRHQAGERTLQVAVQAYADAGIEADVSAFIDDMAAAYEWADFVICRAGALTVAELAVVGVPSILVPFPYAVDDHQTANALYLSRHGAAMLCVQKECEPPLLAARITDMCKRSRRVDMAARAQSLALPDATEKVAKACLQAGGIVL